VQLSPVFPPLADDPKMPVSSALYPAHQPTENVRST
jgi:hypothetical protein